MQAFLSWKYLIARRTNLIGMVGITVAVGALILILAIMTGFLEESRSAVRGSLSDILITPIRTSAASSPTGPVSPRALVDLVASDPRVEAVSPQIRWGGIITRGGSESGKYEHMLSTSTHGGLLAIELVGIDVETEYSVSALRTALDRVDSRDTEYRVADLDLPFATPAGYAPAGRPRASALVGGQLAEMLGMGVGDEFKIATVVRDPASDEYRVNDRSFVMAGAFRSGENEADLGRIYVDRGELSDFLGGTMFFTQILLRTVDYGKDAADLVNALRLDLASEGLIVGGPFADREVRTWEEFRGNLLGAIENERTLMAIMLSLVLVVSGFTIFAILSMMVTEKRRDIGVLSALGETRAGIMCLFLNIAFWDALIGSSLGALLGVLGAFNIDAIERWLSNTFGVQIFNRDVYLFDHIPAIVQPISVVVIVLGAFACALLFAAIPAWRASRLDPLEALRYE